MQIEPSHPSSAVALLAASDAYMAALYPAESNHLEPLDMLAQPNVLFVIGRIAGEVVACGAIKRLDDDSCYGEIKRVFVTEAHRGNGRSAAIMQYLEDDLRSQGIALARLETGIRQPAALGLYRKLGYVERGPFGAYRADPLSVFMEKRLL